MLHISALSLSTFFSGDFFTKHCRCRYTLTLLTLLFSEPMLSADNVRDCQRKSLVSSDRYGKNKKEPREKKTNKETKTKKGRRYVVPNSVKQNARQKWKWIDVFVKTFTSSFSFFSYSSRSSRRLFKQICTHAKSPNQTLLPPASMPELRKPSTAPEPCSCRCHFRGNFFGKYSNIWSHWQ